MSELTIYNRSERYRWAAPYCQGKTVVDIPCYGAGLLDQVALDYTGIDADPALIERMARSQSGSFAVGTLDAIPLPDGFADVIICFEGLDVPGADVVAAIQEWYRVLVSGGRFLCSIRGNLFPTLLDLDQWKHIDQFHQLTETAPSLVLSGYNPSAEVMLTTGVKR